MGHTASDHAETVLLHLVRGTGIAGLVGLKEATELPIDGLGRLRVIRPLLPVRGEVLEYLKECQIGYRFDESNALLDFTRNRLRHELLPLLESSRSGHRRRAGKAVQGGARRDRIRR